jgi:hypothetical protein
MVNRGLGGQDGQASGPGPRAIFASALRTLWEPSERFRKEHMFGKQKGPVAAAPVGPSTSGQAVPKWLVPSECPNCGAKVEQAVAEYQDSPHCAYCEQPLPVRPVQPAQLGQAQPPVEVVGAPGRPVPGAPGGGLTPEQAEAWVAGGKVHATAVVVAAHEVVLPAGMASPAPAGLFDIVLDVTRPDGSSYSVQTRVGFSSPERRARVATVGARLPVLIDEADTSAVAIDTNALFSQKMPPQV